MAVLASLISFNEATGSLVPEKLATTVLFTASSTFASPAPCLLGEKGNCVLPVKGSIETTAVFTNKFLATSTFSRSFKFLNSSLFDIYWSTNAVSPEAWGAAIDVPDIFSYLLLLTVEFIIPPGAERYGLNIKFGVGPHEVKLDISFAAVLFKIVRLSLNISFKLLSAKLSNLVPSVCVILKAGIFIVLSDAMPPIKPGLLLYIIIASAPALCAFNFFSKKGMSPLWTKAILPVRFLLLKSSIVPLPQFSIA